MADVKITGLPTSNALDGSEVVPIVQAGTTKQATVNQVVAKVDSYTKTESDSALSLKQDKLIEGAFVDGDKTKLDGIESGATADQTKAEIDAMGIDAGTVNGKTVEINVPANALFTDTIYDDSAVLKDSDTVSPVTTSNKLITQSDVSSLGGGDMLKSTYDTNNSGIVDNAEKVNNLTVETAVPANALFTDTVYDDSTTTKQSNTFNGASQLVQLDANGKLPAVDGSQLTGISGASSGTGYEITTTVKSGYFYDFYPWERHSNATGSVVGKMYFRPIEIRKSFTIQAIGIRVLSTDAMKIQMAIFSSDVNNMMNLTLEHKATEFSFGGVQNDYAIAIPNNLFLDASKIYWLAVEHDTAGLSGPLTFRSNTISIIGQGHMAQLTNDRTTISVSRTYGTTIPTTLTLDPNKTELYAPILAVQAL